MELLWVCRNFREVVYAIFSKTYKLTFWGNPARILSTRDSWPSCFRDFQVCTPPCRTQELVIELDACLIFGGQAHKVLLDLPQSWFTFPIARLVKLQLNNGGFQAIDEACLSTLEDNVSSFARELRRMAPAANDIWIQGCGYPARISPTSHRRFGDLITQLYRDSTRITLTDNAMSPSINFQVDGISNLVHLSRNLSDNEGRYLYLAQRNAPTLQSLIIKMAPPVDIFGFIQMANGRYVEYPCLHTLELRYFGWVIQKQKRALENAVPFPNLCRLRIDTHYPFIDDTPFRGNAAMLEYLSIILCQDSATMLKQRNVFTPTSHPRLRVVKIQTASQIVPDLSAAYTQFVLSIAPSAQVREINPLVTKVSVLASLLSLQPGFGHIQVLSLPSMYMLLWDAITLVKSLPLLSDLHSRSPNLGPLPVGVSLDELPAYTIAKYSPMGHRFRCWHLTSFSWGDPSEIFRSILLLALVCPNFDYAATHHTFRRPFMLGIVDMIYSDQFKQHSTRLQRLLFDR
ncbi:hypothetical protein GGI20_003945 [Coemansia sp. BCRC 34301]|nr:hypothetical protein GGI20_003945 [Coemansia sp. BCRC 34301]